MECTHVEKSMRRIIAITLIAIAGYGGFCYGAALKEPVPTAPSLEDAHGFFASLVSQKDVLALYTASKDGELLGYIGFPLLKYKGSLCTSEITLSSDTKIDFDWTVVSKLESKDGQMGMWRNQSVTYESFHMLTIEGGVTAKPSNNIPKLILAITDEVSRNRLLKATTLLSSTCRAKTKFD